MLNTTYKARYSIPRECIEKTIEMNQLNLINLALG